MTREQIAQALTDEVLRAFLFDVNDGLHPALMGSYVVALRELVVAALASPPAETPGWRPTSDEWIVIHDALAEAQGEALNKADMWVGRVREPRYRREAAELESVRQKVNALIDAPHTPTPTPSEPI